LLAGHQKSRPEFNVLLSWKKNLKCPFENY
jgi:hypothetical protein